MCSKLPTDCLWLKKTKSFPNRRFNHSSADSSDSSEIHDSFDPSSSSASAGGFFADFGFLVVFALLDGGSSSCPGSSLAILAFFFFAAEPLHLWILLWPLPLAVVSLVVLMIHSLSSSALSPPIVPHLHHTPLVLLGFVVFGKVH